MADAKASAERIERRIDEQLQNAEKSQKVTLGIGLVLIVVLIAYFTFMTGKVKDLMQPESVAQLAAHYAEEHVPKAREALTTQVEQNADKYIKDAVAEIKARIPDGRKQLESVATNVFNDLLRDLDAQLNEMTDYAIEVHQDRVNDWMNYLQDDDGAAALEDELYKTFMEPIETSTLKSDLKAYGIALQELADKVDRLKAGVELTKSEVVERDILIALKVLSERSN